MFLLERNQGIQTISSCHANIQQDKTRVDLTRDFQRFAPRGGFSHDLEFRILQHTANTSAPDGMVVYEQCRDALRLHFLRISSFTHFGSIPSWTAGSKTGKTARIIVPSPGALLNA